MLLYIDGTTSNPTWVPGTEAPINLTAKSDLIPYLPSFQMSLGIPLVMARIPSGTTSWTWDNLYDVRQFFGGFSSTSGSSTTGSSGGNVYGPATNHDSYLPQWNGANSKILKDGLPVVTSIGTPGTDSNIPTEKAVRTAISAISGSSGTGSNYALPTGSSSILGGFRVGQGVYVNPDGTLNSSGTNYVLPTASSSVLGGIKIGAGIAMSGQTAIITGSMGGVFGNPSVTDGHLAVFDVDGYHIKDGGAPTGTSGAGGDIVSPLVSAEISITSTTTATIDRMHVISGTGSDYTINLPASSGNAGKLIGFRVSQSATKLFTLDGNASETINGSLTRILWAGESCILLCDGSNWLKIAGLTIPMMCNLYKTSNTSTPSTGVWTKISVDATYVDNTGEMADLVNYKIIVKRPGKYMLEGNTMVDPGGVTMQYLGGGVYNNGSLVYQIDSPQWTSSGYARAQFPQCVLDLSINDYLELYGYILYSAGSPVFRCTSDFYSHLAITEIPTW